MPAEERPACPGQSVFAALPYRFYCFVPLNAPSAQEEQTPKPEPSCRTKLHTLTRSAISPPPVAPPVSPLMKVKLTGPYVPAGEPGSRVVPQMSRPSCRIFGMVEPATPMACMALIVVLGLQTVYAPPVTVPGTVASTLMTSDVGIAGVSTSLIRSFFADSETKAFGVIKQEQQATSSSDGSNV
jgi:hypothetical protein